MEAALAERQQECSLLSKQLLEISGTSTELKANSQKDVAALHTQVWRHLMHLLITLGIVILYPIRRIRRIVSYGFYDTCKNTA